MKILIDADACPVTMLTEKTAVKYKIKVELFCDTNHLIRSNYSNVHIIDAGTDSVDFAIISQCFKHDIVITQDYGLAAMVLSKSAFAIHPSGMIYTNNNIDNLLMSRHISKKARKSKKAHLKGPAKRTKQDDVSFVQSLEKLITQN